MDEKALVVKSNTLVEASHKLGEVEQNVILLAIVKARENYTTIEQLRGKELQISADDYMTIFGTTRQGAYHALRQAVMGLYRTEWGYKVVNEKGNNVVAYERFTQSAKYIDGEGVVSFRFADAIIPMLLELEKRFTSYEIKQVANLSSGYAMRLYEFFMQYFDKKAGKGWFKISLDDLRFRLGLLPTEYKRMGNFKDYVLDLALQQINENTDINATYTQQKSGRKITGFTFEFKYKKGREPKNQGTISPAKGKIYDGIATEPQPTPQLTAPIAPKTTEPQAPQVMNAGELTELEREAVANANAYADKQNATPSHRQNLVAKALRESREQEQALATEQAQATAKKQAMEQKQRQKEQLFDEFWAVASDDEKKELYVKITPYMGVSLHGVKLKQAVKTGDFSQIDDRFASDEFVRERLLAVFKPRMPTEAPYKPTAPQNTPSPTNGGVMPKEPLQAQNKPKSEPQQNINQIFNDMTKDEQETVKAQALAYINDNGITDPQEVRTIKKRAVIERWGLDVF